MEVLAQQAYHFLDIAHNHDKIWASAVVEVNSTRYDYLAVWGRRNKHYSTVSHSHRSRDSALREFRAKCSEKNGKGYAQVAFNDPNHGTIPAFGSQLEGEEAYVLTSQNLLADIMSFTTRLKDGLVLPDEDSTRLQLASYRVQSAVLLDLPEVESTRLRETTHQLDQVLLSLDTGPELGRSKPASSSKPAILLDL